MTGNRNNNRKQKVVSTRAVKYYSNSLLREYSSTRTSSSTVLCIWPLWLGRWGALCWLTNL